MEKAFRTCRHAVLLVLAVVLIVACVPAESAAAATDTSLVDQLGISVTDKKVSGEVTRAQFAQMLYKMTGAEDTALTGYSVYSDVKQTHWAAKYIAYCAKQGYMSANLKGKFRPGKAITATEAISALTKIVGFTGEKSPKSTTSLMNLAKELKITDEVSVKAGEKLSFVKCKALIYNTLAVEVNGSIYGSRLGCTQSSDGKVIAGSRIVTDRKGPFVNESDEFLALLPVKQASATVYRNDELANWFDVEPYDIIYYSENSNTLWAYSKFVYGTIEKVKDSVLYPTAIELSGKTYELGSTTAVASVKVGGTISAGDVVTCALDSDGKIAAIYSSRTKPVEIFGVVKSVAKRTAMSNSETYIEFSDENGNDQKISCKGSAGGLAAGTAIVYSTRDNTATVKTLTASSLNDVSGVYATGLVSDDGASIGDRIFARNVYIADVTSEGTYELTLDRITGCNIHSGDVLYSRLDKSGNVEVLVLNGYTGDEKQYVYMYYTEYNNGQITFTYDKAGTKTSSRAHTDFTGSATMQVPAAVEFENGQIKKSTSLNTFSSVTSIGIDRIYNAESSMKLSPDVIVYYGESSDVKIMSIAELRSMNLENRQVTAYYDKPEANGGMVRVIRVFK